MTSTGFRPRRQRPLGPLDSRNPMPRRRHGLAPADIDALLRSQGYGCAICGTRDPGDVSWNIDHDHRHCAGMYGCELCVRGLLCRSCNTGLGNFRDDRGRLASAAAYLERAERARRW
ncbi:MAG TPA: endonuclease domain-containing protein [Vicinamibacterales bacterium]|nr:endonuclease domain-containing protein [Vicinamibacterales bacterium]